MTYTRQHDFVPDQLVKSQELDDEFDAIEAAFGDLADPSKLNDGTTIYGSDGGTADAYVVNNDGSSTLVDGQLVSFFVANTNTGPATLNANGSGNKTIVRQDGNNLSAGDLTAGYAIVVMFNNSEDKWYLIAPTMNMINETLRPTIINDATTSRTLSATDESAVIVFSSSSAITVTAPSDASDDLATGFLTHLVADGGGQITVSPDSGVTIIYAASAKTRTEDSAISVIKVASDKFLVIGDQEV